VASGETRGPLALFIVNIPTGTPDGSYSASHAQWIAPVLQAKEWHLLESPSSRVFLTSDNPVTLIRPPKRPPQRWV
jgi:hypothetical protein